MPFAGYIMPQSNQSAWEYTEANFSYCSLSVLRKLAKIATEPIHLMEQSILTLENLLLEAISELIRLLNEIKAYLDKLLKALFNKFQNILIIQLENALVLNDIMHRITGVMTTQYYFAVSVWNTFGAAMNSMWMNIMSFFSILFLSEFGVAFAVAIMIGIATAFQAFVFTFPIGGPLTFVAMAAYGIGEIALLVTIVMAVATMWIGPLINLAFDTHTPLLVPGDPTYFFRKAGLCFAKHTIIPTLHNGPTLIQDLTPGTILSDESVVTSTMILDSTDQPAFFLDNTIVTGSHKVLYNTKWIYVHDHPDAISLPPLIDPIYCFNTTNKRITLHNTTFSDWDDEEGRDIITLHNACQHFLPEPVVFANIHKYLEVGFHPNTKIPMKDGTLKHIGKIKLGEILANGEIVTGCVTILGDVPLYHHETDIIGTATLRSGHTPTKLYTGDTKQLYHLLTNTGFLKINDIIWSDYNDGLERYFE